jgi:hypothetical protein
LGIYSVKPGEEERKNKEGEMTESEKEVKKGMVQKQERRKKK